MVPLEGGTRPHDPGLVPSAFLLWVACSLFHHGEPLKKRRGLRGEGRREEDTNNTHSRKDPWLLGVPSLPERCSYELLQGGHEEQKSRGLQRYRNLGRALSALESGHATS